VLQRSLPFRWLERRRAGHLMEPEPAVSPQRRHAIICGYGGVGRMVSDALARRGFAFVVVDQDRRIVEDLRRRNVPALYGDASNPELLARAGLAEAVVLVVAMSDPAAARLTVERAKSGGRRLYIVARTHSEAEWHHLRAAGADAPIWAERELAATMAGQTLRRYGLTSQEVDAVIRGLRNA
jgi:monovalent cation:H+ antiporter-2, CPA2 family